MSLLHGRQIVDARRKASHDEVLLGLFDHGAERGAGSGSGREGGLVAAAEKRGGNSRGAQHRRQGFIDDAPAGELIGARAVLPRPRDRLDEIAGPRAKPPREPEREAVGGDAPALLDVGPLRDERIGCPHGDKAAVEGGPDVVFGRADLEALAQARDRPGELVHGEKRHAVGRTVAEAEACLAGAHFVGKRPAARNDDNGRARIHNRLEPRSKVGRADDAAAELDYERPAGAVAGGGGEASADGAAAHFASSLVRTISTPTAPGSLSSFSIITRTDAARGCARQRSAIRSASVSTRLI